jgi:hypothetical protein
MKTIKFVYEKVHSFFVSLFGCSKSCVKQEEVKSTVSKKKAGRPAGKRKSKKTSR